MLIICWAIIFRTDNTDRADKAASDSGLSTSSSFVLSDIGECTSCSHCHKEAKSYDEMQQFMVTAARPLRLTHYEYFKGERRVSNEHDERFVESTPSESDEARPHTAAALPPQEVIPRDDESSPLVLKVNVHIDV